MRWALQPMMRATANSGVYSSMGMPGRQIQHAVDEAAVEIHVGADALEDLPFFGDELRGHALDLGVQGQVLVPALLVGQLFHIALEHHLTGVAEGVDRVAHAVDQALVVKGFAVQQFFQVSSSSSSSWSCRFSRMFCIICITIRLAPPWRGPLREHSAAAMAE